MDAITAKNTLPPFAKSGAEILRRKFGRCSHDKIREREAEREALSTNGPTSISTVVVRLGSSGCIDALSSKQRAVTRYA